MIERLHQNDTVYFDRERVRRSPVLVSEVGRALMIVEEVLPGKVSSHPFYPGNDRVILRTHNGRYIAVFSSSVVRMNEGELSTMLHELKNVIASITFNI